MSLRTMRKWKWGGGVVLIVITLWCLAMFLLPRWAKLAYSSDPAASVGRYQLAMRITPKFLQGWESSFNLGTAQAKNKEYSDGIDSLTEALERAPKSERKGKQITKTDEPECKVRRNLSLTYENRGDQAKSAKRSAVARKDFKKAASIIAPCSQNDDKSKKSKNRQDKKANPPSPRPSQNPNQNPNQDPNQNPNQNPGQDPNQNPGQNPGQNPNLNPGQDPNQNPGQDPNQNPNQNPGQNPSQSTSPSSGSNQLPSNRGGSNSSPTPPSDDPSLDEKEKKLRDNNKAGDEDSRQERGGGGGSGVNW